MSSRGDGMLRPVARPRKPAEASPVAELPAEIRDRVKEFRRVPSSEFEDNEKNWRVHPHAQRAALEEVLSKVGIAGALTAYHSERNGGKLTLIDGHERRGHQAEWPTLILDVTDDEADLLLLTLDPITQLAEEDEDMLRELLDDVERPGTPALEDLLQRLTPRAPLPETAEAQDIEDELLDEDGPPEMELQTFEHYDYVVFVFRNAHDWRSARERLGLKDEAFTLRDGMTKKVGLGRVLEGKQLLRMLKVDSKAAAKEAELQALDEEG